MAHRHQVGDRIPILSGSFDRMGILSHKVPNDWADWFV